MPRVVEVIAVSFYDIKILGFRFSGFKSSSRSCDAETLVATLLSIFALMDEDVPAHIISTS